ncbi:MAG: hypothetical protein RLZZ14_498, partial [Actinomycetota bacterium]
LGIAVAIIIIILNGLRLMGII